MLAREPSEENVHSPPDHECWCVPPWWHQFCTMSQDSISLHLFAWCYAWCRIVSLKWRCHQLRHETWKLSDFMLESCSCYWSQVLGTQHSYGSAWQNDHPVTTSGSMVGDNGLYKLYMCVAGLEGRADRQRRGSRASVSSRRRHRSMRWDCISESLAVLFWEDFPLGAWKCYQLCFSLHKQTCDVVCDIFVDQVLSQPCA